MTANIMLIITDASGEIIAACNQDLNAKVQGYITPASPDHKMYRILDVPEKITSLEGANQFHRAITEHFKSKDAKVRLTNAQEHFDFVTYVLSRKAKKATKRKYA